MKVLCFGSLNIDYTYKVDHFVQKGETLSSDKMMTFAGGKGLNQSIALAKAGADVYHAGAIGEEGRFLLEKLRAAEVNTDFVAVLPEIRTGHAIIQNDKQGDNCILLFGGANQEITTKQVDEVLSFFEAGDYLVLQNEINQMSYLMEKAHQNGLKIVLNPSPMNEKILQLPLEYVDCFLLNEVEAGQILNRETVSESMGEELAGELQKRFPAALIVLTLGKRGAMYADRRKSFLQKSYPVKAVDTTAAGDTFTGYFLSGILNGKTEEESMDMAARAAAIAVTKAGAASSIPLPNEVLEYVFD